MNEDDRDDESDYEIYEDWLGEQPKAPSVEEDWYDLYGVSPMSRRVPEVGG
jgi:hypothetical protein